MAREAACLKPYRAVLDGSSFASRKSTGPCYGLPSECRRRCCLRHQLRDSPNPLRILPMRPAHCWSFLLLIRSFRSPIVETYFDYLRAMAHALGERSVQTYRHCSRQRTCRRRSLGRCSANLFRHSRWLSRAWQSISKPPDPRELSLNAVQGRPTCRWARCMSTPARSHTPLS